MNRKSQHNYRQEIVSKQTQKITRNFPRVVYRPESKMRHPLQLFKEMWRDLLASREWFFRT